MQPIVTSLATLTLLIDLTILSLPIIYLMKKKTSLLERKTVSKIQTVLKTRARELSLLTALTATTGSLYLSNVLGWTPCRLCWFQRIFMYPLVVLLTVSLLLDRKDVQDFVIPMTLVGLPISIYHYLVQRVEQFHSAGCSILQVSCQTEYTFHYGYITIPLMAATAFLAILLLMSYYSFSQTE
ncbi:MAG: disulfide bond formation protein B [Candidatus Nanohaloarchaea archaeon]